VSDLDLLLAGVGGQGTLLASTIIAEVGIRAGYDVKKSEVHGMAQRGGAVSSHVRWGQRVFSPLIGAGQADILIALEQLEALRYTQMLHRNSRVLVSDCVIMPVSVTCGDARYPTRAEIVDRLQRIAPAVSLVPGMAIADRLGNPRVNNVVVLGALSVWTAPGAGVWEQVICDCVPAKYRQLNLEAFAEGRRFVESAP